MYCPVVKCTRHTYDTLTGYTHTWHTRNLLILSIVLLLQYMLGVKLPHADYCLELCYFYFYYYQKYSVC
jgi:hypothetical protein